jgi:hypothetical protein
VISEGVADRVLMKSGVAMKAAAAKSTTSQRADMAPL